MHSILLLPLMARSLETIDVCIWRMFLFMSVVVTVKGVCGIVCCVVAVVKDSVVFEPWSVEVCCVFCLYCDAWSCMCSCIGSMSVSSCRCCMFASCGSSQCCSLHDLQFVHAGRECKRRPYGRSILRSGLMTAL